jgi:TetR/AcrR family transcriptional repressor of nem operon
VTTRPPATKPTKPDRRQTIILVAYRAIAEKGFEGLRVRDVAAQVGINGATLHHYFPTKEDLIRAVAQYAHSRFEVTMLDLPGTPAEQLYTHLDRLRKLMQEEPDLFVVFAELTLRAQRDSESRYMLELESIWQQWLADIFRAGIDQKLWASDLDPGTMASGIMTLVEGASLWAMTFPKHAEQALRQLDTWLKMG